MSAVPVSTGRCWILSHSLDHEWIPHYSSELKALHALACEWNEERDDFSSWAPEEELNFEEEYSHLVTSEADEEPDPCCRMVCDGCGLALGQDGEMADVLDHGSHIRSDEFDHVLDAEEWSVGEGGDFCPACPAPVESEEEEGRRPGPLDVPFPFEGVRRCRVCGCTDDHACPAGCSWVAEDLCSACPVAP